jgi:hypothetical protein
MRTIFHIGLPKTGTTTLQNSLHAARGALAGHGVLYPSLEQFGHLNHHPLILSVLPPEKLPRQFRFKGAGERERLAAAAVESVVQEVRAARMGQLLLSSEYFSREFAEDELLRMQVLLARFGVTELTFSFYVRRPSAHYLSLLTQSLRHSAALKPPASFRVRPRIEALQGAFPEARVVPALFERELLAGGDIVPDFVARFLGPLGVSPAEVPALREANVSVSGESTEILMAFRRDAFPGRDNRPEPASAALFETLAGIEARIGARRPLLRAEVAAWLDGSDEDVAWLVKEYGLTFPGLAPGNAPPPPAMERLADVIVIDTAYRARLLEELARSPWAWRPWRRRWVKALAEGRVPGRVLPWV